MTNISLKASNKHAETDTLLPYRGFGNCESSGTIGGADLPLCRLRVFERQGDYRRHSDEVMAKNGFPSQPAARVILLTELLENDGTSVTNMMHRLKTMPLGHCSAATEVFYNRELMGFPADVDELYLPLFQTIVIEHYPPDVPSVAAQPRTDPDLARQSREGYVLQNEVLCPSDGSSAALTGRGNDRFAFVNFDLIEWDSVKSHHAYGKPNWRPTTKADVEMLIGEQWG